MRRIGTAIVGNGMATRVFHAPYILATPALDLRCVVSRNAETPPPADGVPLLRSHEEALADPLVELVVIATPSATHAELARAALHAGKHVVVEKPFALDPAEARDLVYLAASRERLICAFHNRRWDSDFLTMQAALNDGVIGQLVHFESHYDRFRPTVRHRWREDGGAGSGIWYDLGPHLVDQALLLFGLPQAVSADIAALRPDSRANDWAHVTLHYADKRVILHASMCVAGGAPRMVAHGTKGSLIKQGMDRQEAQSMAGLRPSSMEWGIDPDPLLHIDGEGTITRSPALHGCQQHFYAMMADACLGQGPAPVSTDDVLAVQAIVDLALKAHQEGCRLPFTGLPFTALPAKSAS